MGFDRMVDVLKAGCTLDIGKLTVSGAALEEARKRVLECKACALGKGQRTAFGHRGMDKGHAPGETLHMDTYQVPLDDGDRKWLEYGLVVTDPHSEFRWFGWLKSKDEAAAAVIECVQHAQTQGGWTVKRLFADGGTEFINHTLKTFCRQQGIELHYPPARTQQLNGVAERSVRASKDMARTMMLHSGAPMRFWYRAACHAAFVWNRTRVAEATGKTPFEAMWGRQPSARHWGVFGCDAFYHVPKAQRGPFGAKMEPCIYLGHDHAQNCAFVYGLRSRKVVASRDLVYRLTKFTHGAALKEGDEAVEEVLARGYVGDDGAECAGSWDEVEPQGGTEAEAPQGRPRGLTQPLTQPNAANPTTNPTTGRPAGDHATTGRPAGDHAALTQPLTQPHATLTQPLTQPRGAAPPTPPRSPQASPTASPHPPSSSGVLEADVVTWDEEAKDAEQAGAGRSEQEHAGAGARDQGESFDVERILDRRVRGGRAEFLVKWEGYGAEEATWKRREDLAGAAEAVAEYEEAHPSAAAVSWAEPSAPQPTRVSQRARGFGPDGSPVVHMAMSAVRSMQTDKDRMTYDETEVACAVSAGVDLLDSRAPETYQEAMASKDAARWKASMDKEMASCKALDVWEYVPRAELPPGANVLPNKWVYRIKTDENGVVPDDTGFKSRITPKGFKQRYGQDFWEVYAATGMYKTMRLGLSLAAKWDHELEQMDVPTAFLNAGVDEDIYMEIPEGYRAGREHMVCKLKKALYGLKQAPRNWYLLVSAFVKDVLGFKACVSDPCMYHKRSRTGRLILLFLFVDDFQVNFHREDREEWNKHKALLVERFNTKDMGTSTWILGMRIQRDRKARTITLDQELYVTKALEKYGLAQCKVAATPEAVGNELVGDDAALDAPTDVNRYMELTGTLMYAAVATRPDIAHAAYALASHMQAPRRRHMVMAERVLRYLAGTKEVGLVFGAHNGAMVGESRGWTNLQVDVCAFADADWANDKGDRRSITGWVSKLNGDTISWSSKKQRTVALSTCEAELYAEAAAIQEVLWMRGILKELGLRMTTGSIVHGDNQSAIAVSKNGVKGERTKHVDIKYHFVTETVERGEVQLKWVPTTEQQADIFTKALAAPVFEHFRKQLMTR